MSSPGHEVVRSLPGMDDTIAAIATAHGRGAVALIRVSGPRAAEIAQRLVFPWSARANQIFLAEIRDAEGSPLDSALVSFFPGPHSFTGEDVVEISSHGGSIVPQSILAALLGSGARQAYPGEFTRRAVLNGKIDIVQAEAIADLVDARSHSMQRAALSQLDGSLSRRIGELRAELIQLEAFLAYDIDFPEEDDGPVSKERITEHAKKTLASLRSLLATGSVGELMREGAIAVIAGAPNVGKSSLFNALLGYSRAIVTDIPGTTRDALEAVVDLGKFPIRLVDTAGLRDSSDYVEQLGIEVSRKYLGAADIVIACGETEAQLRATIQSLAAPAAKIVPVLTKSDLVSIGYKNADNTGGVIRVSALKGEGIEALLAEIQRALLADHPAPPDTPLLTRARHLNAVRDAEKELNQFVDSWSSASIPATVAAIHVQGAVFALEELIGTVGVEHVLDAVFSSFCVGK